MRFGLIGAALAALLSSTPATAAEVIGGGNCATDLALSGGSALVGCYGRFEGNALNNANNGAINAALDALGYAGPDISYSAVPNSLRLGLNGDRPGAVVNFPGLLNGIVFVGIHSGNGGRQGVGNSTTFYSINAVNLDSFVFNPSGASTATLFASAAVQSAVPEPATWGMMLLGFGAVGASMRRRQTTRVSFA